MSTYKEPAEVWIDETAAAWASGTAGVCNGFLSGFWYIDQLASTMAKGNSAMCRQCLVGGNYSLIEQRHVEGDGHDGNDDNEYDNNNSNGIAAWTPNPDYWVAWLWRTLVAGSSSESTSESTSTSPSGLASTTVLAVNQVMPYEGDFVPETRMYLVCTPHTSPHYETGSVTAIWINQATGNKSILMYQGQRWNRQQVYGEGEEEDTPIEWPQRRQKDGDSPAVPPPFANLPRVEYTLTPHPVGGRQNSTRDVLSREVLVNGLLLAMHPDGGLPLFPVGVEGKVDNMVVPPLSYGFAIYPKANASACVGE